MKRELIKKQLALIIAVLILISIPVLAFAEEGPDADPVISSEDNAVTVPGEEPPAGSDGDAQIPGDDPLAEPEETDPVVSGTDAEKPNEGEESPDSDDVVPEEETVLTEPEEAPPVPARGMMLFAAAPKAACPNCGSTTYQEVKTAAVAPTMTQDGLTEGVKCSACGKYIVEPAVIPRKGDLNLSSIGANKEVYVDGKRYVTDAAGHITLDKDSYTTLVVYKYNTESTKDRHAQYPTGMSVWLLNFTENGYTMTRKSEFDDIMQYCGTSIRVSGKKGVRIITGIPSDKKKALISSGGYAGYTMIEDGTLLAKSIRVTSFNPLVLGSSGIVSNYAYKQGSADPVFKTEKGLSKYTNAVTGFTLQQCVPDFAMRPYMKLKENSTGKVITLYGGIVHRSIQYVANQNKNAFKKGSSAYDFIWSIINAKLPDSQTTSGKLIAHQGYKDAAPENTVAAFELAGKNSAFWGIETDIRQTKDGVLICSHDEEADRMTTGTGRYMDLMYSEVSTFVVDVGSNIANYPNLKVATLSEYLDICKKYGKTAVLDIKYQSVKMVDDIVQMVKDKGMQDKVIFQASTVNYLKEIKSKYTDATMWYLARDINESTVEVALDCACVGINADNITADNVALGKEFGLKTACWTATTVTQKKNYFSYGLDFVCCNKPL